MVNAGDSRPVLTNVTFSNNAAEFGGGMYNSSGSPVLTNVTFSNNSATINYGGMYNVSNSRPLLTNVIIADSTGGDCFNQLGSTLKSASSYNLIKDGTNACGLNNNNGNIIGVDPMLGPLADNGGATQTHALLAGSTPFRIRSPLV